MESENEKTSFHKGEVELNRDPFMTRSRSPTGQSRVRESNAKQVPVGQDPFMTNHLKTNQIPTRSDPFMTHHREGDSDAHKNVLSEDLYNLGNDPFMTHTGAYKKVEAQKVMPAEEFKKKIIKAAAKVTQPAPYWYQSENNFQRCREMMALQFREISEEFKGNMFDEQRVVGDTKVDRAKSFVFKHSGGIAGVAAHTKLRTAHVVDIFQDIHFVGDNRSWLRPGHQEEDTELMIPSQWSRLLQYSTDAPVPYSDMAAGLLNPRPGRVYQGALEDFYLVQAMQAVSMKPQCIRDVFANMEFSNPSLGLFIIRLFKHSQWMPVVIDDAIPMDHRYNPLCSSSEFYPSFSWPSLIEKAYAKLHGSWEALGGGGHVEEAMADLTGGCASRFYTRDVAGDRLWQYLYEMNRFCCFGVSINEVECGARCIPIDKHWASSIFDVKKFQGYPYVCVCTAAPLMTVRHLPFCDVPSDEGYGLAEGFVWLRIEDFKQLFEVVYECRLVNTYFGPPSPGPGLPGSPFTPGYLPGAWFEEIWAYQGEIYGETAPSFLIECPQAPVVITMEVSQTDARYSDREVEYEHGRGVQAPLLLRFFQCSREVDEQHGGEVHLVHLSAWGHCRDAMCVVKVMQPGKFVAMVSMPMRYQCNRMLFRTYSTLPIVVKPTAHRAFISVAPAMPLKAMAYTLTGFPRLDKWEDRLPEMFDEHDGKGEPLKGWRKGFKDLSERMDGEESYGLDITGYFGGRDAVATIDSGETQALECSLM